jgi:hypothetical protein
MLTFRLASHPPKRFSLFEVSQREGDFEAAGAQLHQLLRYFGQPVLTLQHRGTLFFFEGRKGSP